MLENGEAVPIERLVRLNQDGMLGPDKDTARLNYAEAMALTVYIMEGRGGKYRDGFCDYVRDALRGRLRNDGSHQLDDRLGISYKQLDAELLADLETALTTKGIGSHAVESPIRFRVVTRPRRGSAP